MTVEIVAFSDLSAAHLYALLKLRCDVFVVEQNCAYPELDDYDQIAEHLLGWEGEELVAYARLLPPQSVYEQASIGRVCTLSAYRGRGYGRVVFQEALNRMREKFPKRKLKIQAQQYLEEFYASFGFSTQSEPYPDVGIWHVDMILDM